MNSEHNTLEKFMDYILVRIDSPTIPELLHFCNNLVADIIICEIPQGYLIFQ